MEKRERLALEEVFTPMAFPAYTYIGRENERLEAKLRAAHKLPGQIISLVGPSKTGKTVLVKKVVGEGNLIEVSGAIVVRSEDVWNTVLSHLDAPHSTQEVTEDNSSHTLQGEVEGSVPLLAKAKTRAVTQRGNRSAVSRSKEREGLVEVIKRLSSSNNVILIDDFHYIQPNVQVSVAREVKHAADKGVKICVAAVPHRSEDVLRSNPDLSGRLECIDTSYWDNLDLERIARSGFRALRMSMEPLDYVGRFAAESMGSPQLMQAICLNACRELNALQEGERFHTYRTTDDQFMEKVMRRTASFNSSKKIVSMLRQGPKTRGAERLKFDFVDGTEGDVYECVMRALTTAPTRTLTFDKLKNRVSNVCVGVTPRPGAIEDAMTQMSAIAASAESRDVALEWDGQAKTLYIVDPYFYFFLRWGDDRA